MKMQRAIIGLALLPLVPLWQQQSNPPTFHAATHLVQLNVIVHDKDGHPVRDLRKEDFVVLDHGKPQSIGVFSMDTAKTAPPAATLPENTFSDEAQYNGTVPNGVTIILLDNLNTLSSTAPTPFEDSPYWLEALALSNAKNHLIEFLRQLDSENHIAIYGLSDSLHVLCDFTCTRDQLMAVVSKYDTSSKTRREDVEPAPMHAPDMPGPAVDRALSTDVQQMAALNNQRRAQITMAALDGIVSHVADIPGRKNLLWLTGNLPFSGEAIAGILGRADIAAYPVDARGLLPRAPQENKEGYMDEDAYVRGDLSSPTPFSQPVGIAAMQQMANDTGGHAFINTNDLTGAIRKAIEDSIVTYTLGFYIEATALDGKFHEVRVAVKDGGLKVQQPRGYFAWKDTLNADERRHNFVAAIRSPLDYAAIPLQVKVDRVDRPNPHSLEIVASFGIKDIQLAQNTDARTGAVDVYAIQQDAAGSVLQQAANRLNLKLTEQEYAAYLKSGIGFRQILQPVAGTTTLRVLVQDANASSLGSVIVPLAEVK